MTSKRARISKSIEMQVLVASMRRCCLCYFLKRRKNEQKGQLAHLNHNRSNSDFSNLVYLCLNHHDDYDSRTSQSKGYTVKEVEEYRRRLYEELDTTNTPSPTTKIVRESNDSLTEDTNRLKQIAQKSNGKLDFIYKPWKLRVLDEMEPQLFAYKSANRFDGICRIERINLSNDYIVVICEQIDGNPGQSVTNAIEYIAFQLCDQFNINPQKLILIEHYDTWFCNENEWNLVRFEKMPPDFAFENPTWQPITKEDWQKLGFQPRRRKSKRAKQPTSCIQWNKPQK
ncbi:MAG: hypothetical protein WA584_08445 [Pyrinomonadaceae bacterium]